MHAFTPMRPAPGFTLIELVNLLAIAATLLVTGIPTMQGLLQRNLHVTHVNGFVSHLQYARSEAIKRATTVVMCRGNEEGCTRTEGWHEGWVIFADNNHNRELDGNEKPLRLQQGWQNGIEVTSGRRRRVVYQPAGNSPGSNATYVFCNPAYPELARAVILSNSGRPRLSKKRPGGGPLNCR